MASAIPADPWALPAGLEWYVIGDNWAVRTVDGQSLRSHGITIEVLLQLEDLAARRNADDPPKASGRISGGPSAQSIPRARITCPDCHGTRVYVGLGFFPAEPCRTCAGTGKVHDWSAPAELRPLEVAPDTDPWALPPEAVAAGLGWYQGCVSWGVQRMDPWADLYEHPDTHGYGGKFDELDPGLVLQLFELIKRRNVAEPPP
jgi:hypothetical protein